MPSKWVSHDTLCTTTSETHGSKVRSNWDLIWEKVKIIDVKWRLKMKKKAIITKKAPAAIGPYSQAIKAGEFIFVSGQIPIDPSTGELVEGSINEQTRQALENIKAILEAADSSLDRVVKATVFIDDMDDFQAVNEIYSQYFVNDFPARVCVQVAKLPLGARVEIEVVAQIWQEGQSKHFTD